MKNSKKIIFKNQKIVFEPLKPGYGAGWCEVHTTILK